MGEDEPVVEVLDEWKDFVAYGEPFSSLDAVPEEIPEGWVGIYVPIQRLTDPFALDDLLTDPQVRELLVAALPDRRPGWCNCCVRACSEDKSGICRTCRRKWGLGDDPVPNPKCIDSTRPVG